MTDLRVAALCYRYAETRLDNQKTIDRLLPRVKASDIVLLPEDSADPDGTEGESIPGPFTGWLQEKAAFYDVALVANLVERTEGGRFDSCCIIDRTGQMIGKYRKIQLSHSDIHRRGLTPGRTPSVFTRNNICFGVAVCYDVWYPEIVRMQALQGAQIIFAPFKEESQFVSRVRALVSARAVENLIWMVCAGGGSAGAGISYHPFAWIVSPSGEIVRESGEEEFIVYQLRDIEKTRERERALKNWNRPFDTQFGDIRRKDPQIQNKKTARSQ
jgi:predicted amidohydrolase